MLVATALIGSACGSNEGVAANVELVSADGPAPKNARLRVGTHWPLTNVSASGVNAQLDAATLAVAYVDLNGNQSFDAYDEPSTKCDRDAQSWSCSFARTTVTAYRTQLTRLRPSGAKEIGDKTMILGEHYARDWTSQRETQFCLVRGTKETCAAAGAESFGAYGSTNTAIDACALQATLEGDDHLRIRMRSERGELAFEGSRPAPMNLQVSAEQVTDGLLVRGRTAVDITHALIWFGESGAHRVDWSSELDPGRLEISSRSFSGFVPASELKECEDCKLMVQVARIDENGELRTVSEGRTVIERGVFSK